MSTRTKAIVGAVTLVAVGVMLYACHPAMRPVQRESIARSMSGGEIALLSATDRARVCATSPHPGREVPDSAFDARSGYFDWCIPEYHDEQRLYSGNPGPGDYGPIAYSFAWPELSLLVDHAQFDDHYVNVGVIDLDTVLDVMPKPYQDLGLKDWHNCLYLQHHDPLFKKSWFSAVMASLPKTALKCPDAAALTNVTNLDVTIETYSDNYSDYPPVTRFVESGGSNTFIGIQCTNRWCVVGPRRMGAVPAMTHNAVAALKANVRGVVKGWFDDQKLGMPDGTGPYGIHRALYASVVPDPNLGNLHIDDFLRGYQPVAKAYFPVAPPRASKYYVTFGLDAGTNTIELKATTRQKPSAPTGVLDTLWWARVTTEAGVPKPDIPANRVDHSKWLGKVRPAATARFRWFDTDEDVWVQCDIGCCLINGAFY